MKLSHVSNTIPQASIFQRPFSTLCLVREHIKSYESSADTWKFTSTLWVQQLSQLCFELCVGRTFRSRSRCSWWQGTGSSSWRGWHLKCRWKNSTKHARIIFKGYSTQTKVFLLDTRDALCSSSKITEGAKAVPYRWRTLSVRWLCMGTYTTCTATECET